MSVWLQLLLLTMAAAFCVDEDRAEDGEQTASKESPRTEAAATAEAAEAAV